MGRAKSLPSRDCGEMRPITLAAAISSSEEGGSCCVAAMAG